MEVPTLRKSPAIRSQRLLPLCAVLAMFLLLVLLAACAVEGEDRNSEDQEDSRERTSSDRSGDRSSGGSSIFPGSTDAAPEPTRGASTPAAGGPAPTEAARERRGFFDRVRQGSGEDNQPESTKEAGGSMPFTRRDRGGDGVNAEDATPTIAPTPTVAPTKLPVLSGGHPIHRAAFEGEPVEVEELLVPDAPIYAVAKVTRRRADGKQIGVGEFRAPCLAPAFNPNPKVSLIFLDRDKTCRGALALAVYHNPNALEVVTALLDWGLELQNSSDSNELHAAVRTSNLEMVTLLLDRGASIENSYGRDFWHPLHLAIGDPSPEVPALLLDRGANPNATERYGHTPLHFAVRGSRQENVVLLLNYGADVNATGRFNATPLHYADSPEIAELLLDKGADIESRMVVLDEPGTTPLHEAAGSGNLALAELLLERGADIEAQSHRGTPLHHAVSGSDFSSLAMVEMLLDRGADVNARGQSNHTPLHTAAATLDDLLYRTRGWEPVRGRRGQQYLRVLLDRGADVDAKNKGGDTPCQIVGSSRFSNIDQFTSILCP